ncbi:MAG: class I SAM-dependent methyltransferase [Aquiluna sp.]|nr:class I SAM-dependent methyltransferase [Aquiluna sp.]
MPHSAEALLSNEAAAILDILGLVTSKADVIKLTTDLRKQGFDPGLVAQCITQAKLRYRAVAKFGQQKASKMLFTEDGLEQSTRTEVSNWHAKRFSRANVKSVADLGCGIGGDAMAFAGAGIDVTAIEMDSDAAALAAHNLSSYPNAKVSNSDATEAEITTDAIWLDPARRNLSSKAAGRVMLKPEDFSPNLDFAFELARQRSAGIKLAGSLPHELIPEDCEANWVSHNSELVETVLWFGALGIAGKRSAVIIDQDALEFEGEEIPAPLDAPGQYIYDPISAMVRSHLLGAFAIENGLWGISGSIAYLSGDKKVDSPWLRGFEILEVLPLDSKRIAKRMGELDIGTLEIKKRGVDITPEQLRPKLKLKGKKSATLILTKIADSRKALVCQPIAYKD